MADLNTDWALGEYRGDLVQTIEVEYAGTIVAGDLLVPNGVNSNGQLKVVKQTAATIPRFVCPQGSNGSAGDVKEVLLRGPIKVRIGGSVASGASVGVKANKVLAKGNDTSAIIGWSMTSGAVDGDTGVIFFNGGNA